MELGKENNIIQSPLNPGEFAGSGESILDKGYGKIDAQNLIERTRAPRRNPRDGMSFLAPSDNPLSRQAPGINVKGDMYNRG